MSEITEEAGGNTSNPLGIMEETGGKKNQEADDDLSDL